MKYKPLPIGIDDFEKLISRGYYFIDKSMLIKELLDKKADVNLFTRPRRFGKTLNMSMLRYFFEDGHSMDGKETDYAYLFENLKIMQSGEEYLRHMGKYPVISLSLKSAKQPDFAQAYAALVGDIADEFVRHAYVLESDKLTPHKKEKYQALMDEEAGRPEYNKALKFLSECLHIYYGCKAIILIDEYDVPIESAHQYGYYDEMVGFIRSLFESALKTNLHLEFAVITGCLRISKESIFTGLNNLEVISIINKNYDEYFGFTDAEVRALCEDYGMPEKYGVLKEWYNGYVFGRANVYNPWSMIRYVKDLLADINEFPASYWANTGSNSIVRSLIERADQGTKHEIEALIEGKTIEKPIHEDVTYDEVYKSMDNLWNFLFFTGYLRKVSERMEAGQRYVTLAIPNEEVRYIFRNKILDWFREQIEVRNRNGLFAAFVDGDAAAVKEEIEEMLFDTISCFDYYESFYHGFLAGILYGLPGYTVKSNREGGTGRTDLFLRPATRQKTAFVVEFKVAEKYEDMDGKAEEAIRQIEKKEYDRELKSEGYSAIVCYGIAFCRKECAVRIASIGNAGQ